MVIDTKARTVPEIGDLPGQLMAVVTTRGDPDQQSETLSALYGAVYTLKLARKKEGRDFKVAPLRARWPDLLSTAREEWTGIWALPVPDDTAELPQKVPGIDVKLERWTYGPVAQVLYTGSYADEGPTVGALHAFIAEQGYEIAGPHEEVYLNRPGSTVQKTIIRYPVRKRTPDSGVS